MLPFQTGLQNGMTAQKGLAKRDEYVNALKGQYQVATKQKGLPPTHLQYLVSFRLPSLLLLLLLVGSKVSHDEEEEEEAVSRK